jgi:HK97 family phage major capsid protein
MSDQQIVADITKGIGELHEKIEKFGKESADVKSFQEKLMTDVKNFEENRQELDRKHKASQERIEALEKHLAKANAPQNIDVKEVNSIFDDFVKKAQSHETGMSDFLTKSQSAANAATGGNMITPNLLLNRLITNVADVSNMISESTVFSGANMSSITIPKETILISDRAPVGEKQESKDETNVEYQNVTINATRLHTLTAATYDLLKAQSVITEATIGNRCLTNLTNQIQRLCVKGDGISKPKGFLKEKYLLDNALPSQGQTGANTKVTWTDLINVQRLFQYSKYRGVGKFYLNYDVFADLATEKDGEGRPIYMPGINGASQSTLNGKPFVFMPDMDKVLSANTMPLVFGDMKAAYTILLDGNFNVYRDDITQQKAGVILIGLATMAGGATVDENALVAVKGV